MTDLTGTASEFISDTTMWTSSALNTPYIYSYCLDTYLLGGYDVLKDNNGGDFTRTYTGLPIHISIHMTVLFWSLDSWDKNDKDTFYVTIDGTTIQGFGIDHHSYSQRLCGKTTEDDQKAILMNINWPHSALSIVLQFIASLDEPSNNESFGFRDINILFDTTNAISSPSLCATAEVKNLIYDNKCKCPTGSYLSATTCADCDAGCLSCYGGAASECYQCAARFYYNGNICLACYSTCQTCYGTAYNNCLTCISGYYFFNWTSQCLYRCPYPLYSGTDSKGTLVCYSPCAEIEFVYLNRSCSSSCSFPLQQKLLLTTVKLCMTPCSPIEFLYWDGSCQQDCASPLAQRSESGIDYCDFGCDPTLYLYWNGTCSTNCDAPFIKRVQNSRSICLQPCSSDEFLFWDNRCFNSCIFPLIQRLTGGINYCDYPCDVSQFLYWNQSCLADCDFPLYERTTRSRLFCDYPGDITQSLYWDATSFLTCLNPLSQRTEGTLMQRSFCNYTCSSQWNYLYWNSSCSIECAFPLSTKVQNNRRFCNYDCLSSQFLFWNGSCLSSCNPPLSTRNEGGYQFCNYPTNANNFLYWDGSSSSQCLYPLSQVIEGSPVIRKFCIFPCSSTEYLYWDSTCSPLCDPPFVGSSQSSRLFCNKPDKFLYFNGTYLDTCDSPFIQAYNYSDKFCKYPCSSTSDFYYWNGSCSSSCIAPLISYVNGNLKECFFPCKEYQFLSSNYSCLSRCDSPFKISRRLGIRYCINPCLSSEFLYWNGSCIGLCVLPLRQMNMTDGNLCLLPCINSTDYYDEESVKCIKRCLTPKLPNDKSYFSCPVPLTATMSSGSFFDYLLKPPTNSNVPTLVVLIRMLQYIRYLDIPMPPRLEKLAVSRGRNILSIRFGFEMPQEVRAKFAAHSLPSLYKKHNLSSEFVVNFWYELTSWIIMAIAALIFLALERICHLKWRTLGEISKAIKNILKWNACIILIATSVDEIIFYSALEFQSLGLGSAFSNLSFGVCLSILVLTILFLFGVYRLAWRAKLQTRKIKPAKEDKTQSSSGHLQELQVIFTGFKGDLSPNHLFFLLYTIRIAFSMIISTSLSSTPKAQTILYVTHSTIIILYILIWQPLTRKISFIQLLLIETIILVINISLLLLVLSIQAGNSNESSLAILLGDIVIFGNSCINLLIIFFFVYRVVEACIAIYKIETTQKYAKITLWPQLLSYFVQAGGMGFEEIFINARVAEILKGSKYLLTQQNINTAPKIQEAQDMFKSTPSQSLKNTNLKTKNHIGQGSGLYSTFFGGPETMQKIPKESFLDNTHTRSSIDLPSDARRLNMTNSFLKPQRLETDTALQLTTEEQFISDLYRPNFEFFPNSTTDSNRGDSKLRRYKSSPKLDSIQEIDIRDKESPKIDVNFLKELDMQARKENNNLDHDGSINLNDTFAPKVGKPTEDISIPDILDDAFCPNLDKNKDMLF